MKKPMILIATFIAIMTTSSYASAHNGNRGMGYHHRVYQSAPQGKQYNQYNQYNQNRKVVQGQQYNQNRPCGQYYADCPYKDGSGRYHAQRNNAGRGYNRQ